MAKPSRSPTIRSPGRDRPGSGVNQLRYQYRIDENSGLPSTKGTRYLVILGVATGGLLAVDQIPIDLDFKDAAARRNQDELLDRFFEFFEQLFSHADRTICVVSGHAIFEPELHERSFRKINAAKPTQIRVSPI